MRRNSLLQLVFGELPDVFLKVLKVFGLLRMLYGSRPQAQKDAAKQWEIVNHCGSSPIA